VRSPASPSQGHPSPTEGQRRLIRRRAAGLAALALLAGCGGGASTPSPTTTARTAVAPPPASTATTPAPPPGPALGIVESNPFLLGPGAQPDQRIAFYRDRLAALQPTYVRVLVDWSQLQPTPAPPDLAVMTDGCMRGLGPCLPWAKIRDTLRAIRALGATPVLSLYGTPSWAVKPVAGCERDGARDFARMPDLTAYRAFVRDLITLGQNEQIELPYWSPWNEPNLAGFLNPQRTACDKASPALAPGLYAQIAEAAGAELQAAPGNQRLLLGEAAGIAAPRPKATGAAELLAALPPSLVCGAAAWAQHAYPVRIRRGGRSVEPVPAAETDGMITDVERALDAKACPDRIPIWITETGMGDVPRACTAMGERLEAWAKDPRIAAIFQYTFREDPVFPVGLANAELTELRPVYGAWLSRGTSGCPPGT